MHQALSVASLASSTRDVPVGALLLSPEGTLLTSAYNRRELDEDPTAHAEILVLREGSRLRRSWRLDGCTLVCTLEPCLMCAGALLNARIARLVYGADDPKAGAVRSRFAVLDDPRLPHRVEVHRGIEGAACAAALSTFFAGLRAEDQK
ncbi:MAG: nucleoside deaminase [Polyangiaceae bacterium]|nr:nucleoside deaminase [Polyangiaceae bacterium]